MNRHKFENQQHHHQPDPRRHNLLRRNRLSAYSSAFVCQVVPQLPRAELSKKRSRGALEWGVEFAQTSATSKQTMAKRPGSYLINRFERARLQPRRPEAG